MSLLGAVLAGGGSRRFGSPKTLARLHGTPLWKVVAGRLREVCDDVVAIVNHPGVARAVELETLPDRLRLMGPLAGIDAALDRALGDGHAAVMVLAVDMPWVEVRALRLLADAWRQNGRVSLAEMEEPWGFHPLCGVYPVKTVGPLAEALSRRRLEAGPFAGSLDPLVVDTGLPAASFRSVNRPADLPPPAVSVIGNKKSGKTTLAVNLIAELRGRGRRVMSAKHGHHFRLDTPGTDSWRHRHEGRAERVLLVGPDEFGLMGEWDPHGEQSLDLLLTRHLTDAEIVVAEGFRKAAIPKVEIYRAEVQPEPVLDPAGARAMGAIAAVTDRPDLPWSVPVFDPDDADTPTRVADLAEAALL